MSLDRVGYCDMFVHDDACLFAAEIAWGSVHTGVVSLRAFFRVAVSYPSGRRFGYILDASNSSLQSLNTI